MPPTQNGHSVLGRFGRAWRLRVDRTYAERKPPELTSIVVIIVLDALFALCANALDV